MQRKFIFDGGQSKRYHTALVLKEQNIAEHSFGVAWFCELLTQGQARKELIMAALAHDLAEHMVGDIPSPVKRQLGVSEQFHRFEHGHLRTAGLGTYEDELYQGEQATLKLADMMDGMMYCIRERRLGNQEIEPIYERFELYARQVISKYGNEESATSWTYNINIADEFIYQMTEEWRKANAS